MAGTNDKTARIVARYLKGEMVKAGVDAAELAQRMTAAGSPETADSVRMKLKRGTFPAWFFWLALKALGKTTVHLD